VEDSGKTWSGNGVAHVHCLFIRDVRVGRTRGRRGEGGREGREGGRKKREMIYIDR